ncbi:outer membrane protein, YaiO family [Kriegella aquimaris]|uniref:Outer membrane protein, YaiO family n=2 Tax=Kriegella aquimaris TaxID=192904 RepID=A0A1G9IU07_9FLAO|nr:outer membrane protein, YaiO family [Kriegella aquimaris]
MALLVIPLLGEAQELAYEGDPDVSFFTARNLAFEGNRNIARDTLYRILSKYPDYTDVRSLLASTYSWDGDYDKARSHFNRITSVERKNKEVWVATIKNEIYAENYYLALGLANKAVSYLESDLDIIALQTKALALVKGKEEATEKHVVVETPIDTLTEVKGLKNGVKISNSFEIFDVVYDPMIYSSMSYGRETGAGLVIPRINYSNRFQTHGVQYEMDFYPKFSKTFYGYLNYGYSNAPIFPDHRVGAELYANLPKSLEASLGMRFLDFNTTKAQIYTGSIGLYSGNYYFSLRPYLTPQSNGNMTFSGNLLVRKYLRDGENYLGINFGMGYSPELKQLRDEDELLAETVLFIESQRLGMEYQFTAKRSPNIYKASLGVNRQELVFDSGNFTWSIAAGISYEIKF